MAGVGLALTVTCTSDVLGVQLVRLIVHLKVYVPVINPVTAVVGEEGVVIEGVFGPLINDQSPVPVNGVLPDSVVEVARQRL